jgi:alcohol dehydrogenase
VFGVDSINQLPDFVKRYKGSKVALITDNGLVKVGVAGIVEDVLKNNSIEYTLYSDVEPDPTIETVEKIAEFAKLNNIDMFIALGGGSAIDATKGARVLLANNDDLRKFTGMNKVPNPGFPLIAIPTTAGTGSEVTSFAVISDTENNFKFSIGSDYVSPDLALLDPKLTVGLPPKFTAATGLDALTHAIEAYISRVNQPITDMMALDSIELIFNYLPQTVTNGGNIDNRTAMLEAQLLAGVAFNNAFLGLCHAIAHPLGSYCHIPHGIANAIMLPHVLKFNLPSCPERYVDMANAMGLKLDGEDMYDNAMKVVHAVEKLNEICNIPKKLSEIGVREDQIDIIAEDSIKSGMIKFSPRTVSKEQIKDMLLAVL